MSLIKRPKLSIYLRLVLTFLFIVAPLYAVSAQMNRVGQNSVKEEISSSMLAKVHFYLASLDQDFSKTIKLGREYITDDDIGKLSVAASIMPDYERTKAMLRLQKQMLLLKASSSYITNASIHISMLDRTISSNSGVDIIPKDEFNVLSTSEQRGYSPFIAWKNRLFISMPYPENILSEEEPSYLVDIEIDQQEIVKALGDMIDNAQGGALLIDDRNQWGLSSLHRPETETGLRDWVTGKISSGSKKGVESIEIGSKVYFISYEHSSTMNAVLLTYLPQDSVLGPLNTYRFWFRLFSIISIFIIAYFSYIIYRLIHQPLRTLVKAFRSVEHGNFNHVVSYRFKDEFSYLYIQFNAMLEHIRVLIHEVYEQKYRAKVSEFRQLQSQINPHFLYNSFFTLSRIAKNEDYESVTTFAQYLGQYFQFVTRDGDGEVTLEAEWMFVKTYVDIQSFRFSNRISVQLGELPSAYKKREVPRLILQPIVENVYNHGLVNKKKDGMIEITFEEAANCIVIAVEDNGDELTDERLRELQSKLGSEQPPLETTGLVNVNRRIQIKFGDRYGLRMSRGKLGGLRVEMTIPSEGEDRI
ncbi:sensor histidine kinase [Paenibacillus sp. Y412MC10]|uniref:sensor histidine kinase n=1 Tax=Geobacillus sp. (strain Y412MC10) TaxID=481743 RepID=UPI0011A8FC4F|nr:histidine kinase [Paenibacillus sp. Y412MC10]